MYQTCWKIHSRGVEQFGENVEFQIVSLDETRTRRKNSLLLMTWLTLFVLVVVRLNPKTNANVEYMSNWTLSDMRAGESGFYLANFAAGTVRFFSSLLLLLLFD